MAPRRTRGPRAASRASVPAKRRAPQAHPPASQTPPAAVVPGSVPERAGPRPLLREPPHAHAVCRVCGRISEVELSTDDSLRLETIVARPPDGWSLDAITVGMTGGCPRCRANGSA